MRRFLIVLILVAIVAVGALYGALRLFAPPDKIREYLTAQVGDALGLELKIGSVEPSLYPIGAKISDLSLENPAGSEFDPLAVLETGSISLRILPLLSRRIEISHALLQGLELTLVKGEKGKLILPGEPVDDDGQAAPGPAAADFALLLSLAELRDASVRIIDPHKGSELTIGSLDMKTSLDIERGGERLSAKGRADFHEVQSTEFAALGIDSGIKLILAEYDLTIHPAEETTKLENVTITIGDLSLVAQGELRGFEGPPAGEITFSAPDLEVSDLLSLAGEGSPGAKGLRGEGPVSFAGDLTLAGEAPPRYQIQLDLGGVSIGNINIAEGIENLEGRIELTEKSIGFEDLSFEIGGESLRLHGTIDQGDHPESDLELRGKLDLDLIERIGLTPEGVSLGGKLGMDLHLTGNPDDPGSVALNGNVIIENGSVEHPALALPVRDVDGTIRFMGDVIRADSLSAVLGRSHLQLALRVDDPMGEGRVRIDARGDVIDLDEILVLPDTASVNGATGGATAGTLPPPAPIVPPLPNITATGTIRADTFITAGNILTGVQIDFDMADGVARTDLIMEEGVFGEIRFLDARSELVTKDGVITGPVRAATVWATRIKLTRARGDLKITQDGRIHVGNVTAGVYQGRVEGDVVVQIDGPLPEDVSYEFKIDATGLEANEFLSALTPAKNVLYGKFNMKSEWSGRGLEEEEMLRNLRANGKAETIDGELKNLQALNAVADFLGLRELKEQKFRTFYSGFRIEDGRLATDGITMTGEAADWDASGSIGFDGTLDYAITATMSPALSDQLKRKSSLSSLFTDRAGRVVLDFLVTGTTKKPDVSYDLAKAASRSGLGQFGTLIEEWSKDGKLEQAIEGILGGGEGNGGGLEDLLGGFFKKKAPPDTTK